MSSPRALKRAEDSSKNLNKAFTPTMRTRSSDEGRPSEIAEEDEHPPPSDHPPSAPAEKEAGAGDGAAHLSPQSSTNSVRGRQISAKSSRSLRASMRSLFSSFRDNARFGTYEHVRGAKGGAFEGRGGAGHSAWPWSTITSWASSYVGPRAGLAVVQLAEAIVSPAPERPLRVVQRDQPLVQVELSSPGELDGAIESSIS